METYLSTDGIIIPSGGILKCVLDCSRSVVMLTSLRKLGPAISRNSISRIVVYLTPPWKPQILKILLGSDRYIITYLSVTPGHFLLTLGTIPTWEGGIPSDDVITQRGTSLTQERVIGLRQLLTSVAVILKGQESNSGERLRPAVLTCFNNTLTIDREIS